MSPRRKEDPEDRICTLCPGTPMIRSTRAALLMHAKNKHRANASQIPRFTGNLDDAIVAMKGGGVGVQVQPPATSKKLDDLALDLILEQLFPDGIPTLKIRKVLEWIDCTKELMA